MKKAKHFPIILGALTISLALFGCASLPTIDDTEETPDFPLGPQTSLKEHQNLVFEKLWTYIEQSYIYYETSDINWDSLRQDYVDKINDGLTTDEFSSLLNELETDLPANEFVYQARTERIENEIADTSSYGGIGAFIGFQETDVPHVVILDVMPGSPAENAGLQAHDSIVAIDGEAVSLEEGLNAVNRIRGLAGTTAILTVQTPGEADREVELTRAQLTGAGKLKFAQLANTDVGYVLFPPAAYTTMTDEVLQVLSNFSANQDLKGVILDLRISNAIANWPVDAMLSLFQTGRIGEVYDRSGSQLLQLNGQDMFGSQTVPLVILVGENTRGLPEVFAAAMQSNDRATVIGSNTSGNIETLVGFLLPDGSQAFIASASFRRADGEEIGVNGIRPEVEIEARWDQIIQDQDPVIEAAIASFEVEQ